MSCQLHYVPLISSQQQIRKTQLFHNRDVTSHEVLQLIMHLATYSFVGGCYRQPFLRLLLTWVIWLKTTGKSPCGNQNERWLLIPSRKRNLSSIFTYYLSTGVPKSSDSKPKWLICITQGPIQFVKWQSWSIFAISKWWCYVNNSAHAFGRYKFLCISTV